MTLSLAMLVKLRRYQGVSYSHRPNDPFPNSHLPVLTYHGLFSLMCDKKQAQKTIQEFVVQNGWRADWTDQVLSRHHYHSTAHEALAVVSGGALFEIGGPGGTQPSLKKGDVIILPAGVAHRCMEKTDDLKIVGIYPYGQMYDMCYGKEDKDVVRRNIEAVVCPKLDPFLGDEGMIVDWHRKS